MRWTGVAALAMAAWGCSSVLGDSPAADGDGGSEPRPDSAVAPADAAVDGDPVPALFTPSNVPLGTFASGTAALILELADSPVVIDTDTGRILAQGTADIRPAGVVYTRSAQGGDAPELGVFAATDVAIAAGVVVDIRGSASLVVVASGTIRIGGTIDATGGRGDLIASGPGGRAGGVAADVNGRGPGGGAGVDSAVDLGGAGAGYVALGGSGGNQVDDLGPTGGIPYGTETLVPLLGGSGGGFGGGAQDGADGGRGGGGGGAIQLTALRRVHLEASGVINVGGSGGEGGILGDCGGGGGSGGAVLIEAHAIDLDGIVAANGGGGGAGANGDARGAPGRAGLAGVGAAPGGVASSVGGAGGTGGASGLAAGGPGQSADLETIDHGGGGGGAGGRIRLRTDDLSQSGAIVSPLAGVVTAPL